MIALQKYRILGCLVIFQLIVLINIKSQDAHFADILNGNLNENPSAISAFNNSFLKLSYRNQWPGAGSTYITYDAMFNLKVESLKSNFFIIMNRNTEGRDIIMKNSFGLGYGYFLKVNRYIDITGGFSVNYKIRDVNYSNLNFEDNAALPSLGENAIHFFDYNIGFTTIINNQHFCGLAVQHITQPGYDNSSPEEERLYRKYMVSYISRINFGRGFDPYAIELKPAVFIMYQEPSAMILYGIQAFVRPLNMGFWLRQNGLKQISAASLLLGTSFEKIEFNYVYDINLLKKQWVSTKMGAHEVTFLYKFEYKERRKKPKAINCPKL